jgi:hypothetical protein
MTAFARCTERSPTFNRLMIAVAEDIDVVGAVDLQYVEVERFT